MAVRYSGWAKEKVKWIFWGLILNHFHFNLNLGSVGVDLLPDFAGFFLFYAAIDGLSLNLPGYGRMKALAIFFTLVEGAEFAMGLLGVQLEKSAWMLFGSVLFSLLFAYFDYQLFTVLMDTAHVHRYMLRLESLRTIRIARLVIDLLAAVVSFLANRAPLAVSVFSVTGIAVAIWSCVAVYQLWKELDRNEAVMN